ncbi:hypothetical protein Fmac_026560 [Flemingia macrophylla]|uniref:Uncharacterized protein n=1 Tax=Flemingia macrophylla TaxID=520843 RepID=A0ABD1LF80_9FABA
MVPEEEFTKKLIMLLCFLSVKPSDIIEHPKLAHCSFNGFINSLVYSTSF